MELFVLKNFRLLVLYDYLSHLISPISVTLFFISGVNYHKISNYWLEEIMSFSHNFVKYYTFSFCRYTDIVHLYFLVLIRLKEFIYF